MRKSWCEEMEDRRAILRGEIVWISRMEQTEEIQMTKIEKLLEKHEGRRNMAYKDSKGIWTIGIGHNLEANSIPDEAVSIIFAADKANVDSDISNSFPWYSSLDEVRQGVVVDVVFNMGLPRFKGFKNTIRYIKQGDYDKAADELLDSDAARDLPKRYNELSEMMRTGEWQF